MPIKGLTDKASVQLGRGLPLIGRLRKGDKKKANRPGEDLTYFRIEMEPGYTGLMDAFDALYGSEPQHFNDIRLIANTPDEAFETWLEEWGAGQKLKLRTDGEIVYREYKELPGTGGNFGYVDSMRPLTTAERTRVDEAKDIKPVGYANILLPEFSEVTGVLGYFRITTHSIHDIRTVHGYLTDIAAMYGKLTGVPFKFGRSVREVSAPMGGDKRGVTRKSLFYIHVDGTYTREVMLPQIKNNLEAVETAPALAPGQVGTFDLEAGSDVVDAEPADEGPPNKVFSGTRRLSGDPFDTPAPDDDLDTPDEDEVADDDEASEFDPAAIGF